MSRKKELEQLRSQLETERSSFVTHWRDLADYFLPRRTRFSVTDVNKGDRRNQKIYDSTGTYAARTLRSGMMSGVTSPARPWFRLSTGDERLNELAPVKQWLYGVTNAMISVFIKSNLYNSLPSVYGDIGVFGTSAMYVEEDMENVIHTLPMAIGSYSIANDDRLRPRVFVRDFRLTVRQLVMKFGQRGSGGKIIWDNFSVNVRNLYEQGNLDTWIDVTHIIRPNPKYNPDKILSKYKMFESLYYERGSGHGEYADDIFLKESGYDRFPVLCPRWEVTGEDVYGTDCPGMQALSDVKALQIMQKRKAQAVEKMVNPPMTAPTSMRNSPSTILPGGITYVDSREQQGGFRPAHEVNPRIQEILLDIQDHQMRIRKGLFEDLFLMLSTSDRRQFTAREIDERHEEKLLALGPVLEQLNQDLLDPLIDITFDFMLKQGRIPPPPEELQGMELKVEYISIMAQAQKMVGVGSVERFLGFAAQVGSIVPSALDKVDADQAVDVYGEMMSIPPGIIRTDEDVAAMRAQRAEQEQAAQEMQQAQVMSQAAKNLSQSPMQGDSALTRLVDASSEEAIA